MSVIQTNPRRDYGIVVAKVSVTTVIHAHTLFAYTAFFIALIVGCLTHYHKIVENEFYGYPQEWLPSVSATIGDRYPARALFQIFIALTSGPRFILVFVNYLRSKSAFPPRWRTVFLAIGLARTVACGGWVYVTSTDDHSLHDFAMITYVILTLPWMVGNIMIPSNEKTSPSKWRKRICYAFFGSLMPLAYLFIQHKIYHVPGAYTYYAMFEWSLIIYDIAFDAMTALEMEGVDMEVVDMSGNDKFV
ncbi:uncharacterized protein VTP21DRAFT_4586 [Calcarisporiella thermophila]|uniref:uncharacterized protein n=1 Tax=Calcarisporiella thermophila TaxID=911321 RepID=UPI0037448D2F